MKNKTLIQFYYPCGITEEEYNKWWGNEMRKLEYEFWYGNYKEHQLYKVQQGEITLSDYIEGLNTNNMKQKLILYEIPLDRDMYFDSYEEMAKHLDVKPSKLKRIVNTDEIINYIYQIKTK